MSEPPILPAEPTPGAAPFGDRPVEPRAGGCSKPALIGCGVVFLLLGVVGLVLLPNTKNVLVWSLNLVQEGIAANLPPDATEADRERFNAAFAAAKSNIEAGRIDKSAMEALQGELMNAVRQPSGKLTREQLLELIAALERVGGITPPVEPAAPVPEPVPDPAPDAAPPSGSGVAAAIMSTA